MLVQWKIIIFWRKNQINTFIALPGVASADNMYKFELKIETVLVADQMLRILTDTMSLSFSVLLETTKQFNLMTACI